MAQDFDNPQLSAPGLWAMDPQAVWPAAERATVRAARTHPAQVTPEMLATLTTPLQATLAPELQPALQAPAATLLAHWCSVHNLGVHWASLPAVPLLALRFSGLPAWQAALSSQGLTAEMQATALWLMSGAEADAAFS